MCLEIEKLDRKSFQFFPLRNNIYPKHISLETAVLVELFKLPQKLNSNVMKNQEYIWKKIFKIDHPVFNQSNYQFDHKIKTNCFDVSIQLINIKYIESNKKMKMNKQTKKVINNSLRENMNNEEKIKFKNDNINKKEEIKEEILIKNYQYKKDKIKEFKSKPNEEKIKIIKSLHEFKYIDDLDDDEILELKKSKWVVVDPGKNTLLCMKNKKGTKFNYTNRNHMHITRRLKYHKILKNYKDKNKITKIENKLSNFNSKSCDYLNFQQFTLNKNNINLLLSKKYEAKIFRKYSYFSYLNKIKAHTTLIKQIKRKFGKNPIFCFGDWSRGKQMKGITSTPNLRLKRLIADHFIVYNLDEYNTSKINCYTKKENSNLWLPDKKNKSRKIHSVLTYQMENNRLGCINRDLNAVNNMVTIVKYLIKNKNRPEEFKRNVKTKTQKKMVTLSQVPSCPTKSNISIII